jgi:conjugal transfer/entry exclusion protein
VRLRCAVSSSILAVALLSGVACGRAEPLDAAAQQSVDEAEAAAAEALDVAESLEVRVAGVESDLLEARRARRVLERGFASKQRRLADSVAELRSAIKDLRSASANASDEAKSALGTATTATRDVAVLTRRFDYHLRSHGDR